MRRRFILACILMALPGVVALTEASNPIPRNGCAVRAQVEFWNQATSAHAGSVSTDLPTITYPLLVAPSGFF